MRSNIGGTDKVIRVTIAVAIGSVVFSQLITGIPAIAFFLVAYLLMVTVFKGSCPIYRLFGWNTHKNLNDKARLYDFNQRNQTLLRNYLKNYEERYPNIENRLNA